MEALELILKAWAWPAVTVLSVLIVCVTAYSIVEVYLERTYGKDD